MSIPFIQSTTWLVDHLLTGSMTRAIVKVCAMGAKQRYERCASAHSDFSYKIRAQRELCLFFIIRCMFTLQILLRSLQTWSFEFNAFPFIAAFRETAVGILLDLPCPVATHYASSSVLSYLFATLLRFSHPITVIQKHGRKTTAHSSSCLPRLQVLA